MPAFEDDDFFGLHKLDSIAFPQSFQQKSYTKKMKNKTANLIEEQFFPSLVGEEKGQNEGKETVKDFFEEHFERRNLIDTPGEIIRNEVLSRTPQENSVVDDFELIGVEKSGIKELWSFIDPVWRFDVEKLVDFMAERVVYESDDAIAFDKPVQVAYSGAPKDQAQLDRILQLLKKRVAPNADRLYLVSSLDKACSGIIIFAKTKEKQQQLKALLDQGHFYFRFRCLCKNYPSQEAEKTRISIPLVKVLRDKNVKLCPLVGRARPNRQIFHLNTDCALLALNKSARVSLIDAFTRSEMANLVRSHLYYGLDCPLVGDQKYTRPNQSSRPNTALKVKLHTQAMSALDLQKNDLRKLPMFMHLGEVHLPERAGGGIDNSFTVIRAEMPRFFAYALKKLSLFKK